VLDVSEVRDQLVIEYRVSACDIAFFLKVGLPSKSSGSFLKLFNSREVTQMLSVTIISAKASSPCLKGSALVMVF
jgi:hypothetical protein